MNIYYNDKANLLYLRLDEKKQEVINKQVSDDVVLDIGRNERIVGIEIMNASTHVDLKSLLPVQYTATAV